MGFTNDVLAAVQFRLLHGLHLPREGDRLRRLEAYLIERANRD